jgi:hypothetical protein
MESTDFIQYNTDDEPPFPYSLPSQVNEGNTGSDSPGTVFLLQGAGRGKHLSTPSWMTEH